MSPTTPEPPDNAVGPDEAVDKLAEAQMLYEQYLRVADVAKTAVSANVQPAPGSTPLLPYASTLRLT